MQEYHKYVFDHESRSLVGHFEEMYQQESIAKFDSWHQEDSRQLNRKIALEILSGYNFESILDIGTGKGALTHQLKKHNNRVTGLDISPTAVELARSRFPDIQFDVLDVNDISAFENYVDAAFGKAFDEPLVDLVFTAECLSYIEHWRELISAISLRTKYLMIVLFIPENPIGFVKSVDMLESEVDKYFNIIELVFIKKSRFVILFGKNLKQ